METGKYLLVLGVGNILLTDEGIGVHAVNDLSKEDWPEGVDFLDGGTCTQDMYYLFNGYEHLLVLDVVHGGKEPGTLFLLDEQDLIQNEKQRLSLHDIDLLDSLKMADLTGKRPLLRIVGIQPKDMTTWSMDMTDQLKAIFPKFKDLARQEIVRILALRS
ncbi:hydrogenase maturation protease [Desulfocurvibacter africanus PCS]|uniref:Hydrogenase maturation protease n=1 Tax=Desulfocurvibacter africanus PCS TaxID=1262666 RepID=M5PWQ0_DESAF|nr:NiFeSe hydrogenase maturation protease [Desulfocurvibacter africanus]EMG38742.1 hydrogenase maturation protease [Desulfocurvibacter africanus PCS]